MNRCLTMRQIERDSVLNAKSISNVLVANVDLSNASLSHLKANGVAFQGVNLRAAALNDIRWRDCKLAEVNVEGVNASSCIMRMCSFERVSASRSRFAGGILENCTALACDFSFANFCGASLTDSRFNRATFQGADLTDADAGLCDLRGADFRDAVLRRTRFRDADLRGADFTGAIIENADFRGADTRGAQFDEGVAALHGEGSRESFTLFPPTELVASVAPLVAGLLKRASEHGVVDEGVWQAELDETLRAFGATGLDRVAVAQWDAQIGDLLRSAGAVGIDELLESLKSDSEETPAAVAELLQRLGRDLGLKPDATADELLPALVAKLKRMGAS
jgi:uncharacterized protein YjbI with pentapeptide repeats